MKAMMSTPWTEEDPWEWTPLDHAAGWRFLQSEKWPSAARWRVDADVKRVGGSARCSRLVLFHNRARTQRLHSGPTAMLWICLDDDRYHRQWRIYQYLRDPWEFVLSRPVPFRGIMPLLLQVRNLTIEAFVLGGRSVYEKKFHGCADVTVAQVLSDVATTLERADVISHNVQVMATLVGGPHQILNESEVLIRTRFVHRHAAIVKARKRKRVSLWSSTAG